MVGDQIMVEMTRRILGCAIEVHRELGPWLLESTYRTCLVRQLLMEGFSVAEEVGISITYKGQAVESAYRADLIVDESVLLELKALERLLPIHEAQTLTYLKHSGLRVGLLINFNVTSLIRGVRRYIR